MVLKNSLNTSVEKKKYIYIYTLYKAFSGVAVRLSYTQDVQCLKVKGRVPRNFTQVGISLNSVQLHFFYLTDKKNYRSVLRNVQQKDQDKCQDK
jgi:hypothetical protein